MDWTGLFCNSSSTTRLLVYKDQVCSTRNCRVILYTLSNLRESYQMVSKLYLLWLLFFLGWWSHCDGCWDHEKTGLLQIKPFFDDVKKWGEGSSDCCEWKGVECNNSTRRVFRLFLNGTVPYWKDQWYLNVSLFLPFEELHSLYLRRNAIAGFVGHQGFEKLSKKLDKLEILDLSYNQFNNSIFASLSQLSSLSNLKSLDISDNRLEGAIHIKELNALSSLEKLYMGYNQVNDFVLSQDNETELNSINLKVLDLSGNYFNKSILAFLGSLSNLKSLSFGVNQLQGPIYLTELNALTHLEDLSLDCGHVSYSDVKCSLPFQSLGLFPSLKTLALTRLNIQGTIMNFQNKRHNFSNLEELLVDSSFFETSIFRSIGQFSSLKRLELSSSEINGSITLEGLCELTNLEELNLKFNNLEGILPECFSNLTSLESLDISSNQFSGNIYVLENFTSLEWLDLSSNQFSGNIYVLENLTSLKWLDLSSNQFSGNINSLKSLVSLPELRLSNNNFEIPISLEPLFNLSKLQHIYADNNTVYAETQMHSLGAPKFQLKEISLSCYGDVGSFPEFLYHQHDLESLDLSNMFFEGNQFPYWLLDNNTKLEWLYLINTSLSGPLQLPLASHIGLSRLDISINFFNGSIPVEIGEQLPSLEFLNMSNNHFNGSIPSSFGDMNSLSTLDLSNNKLKGNIFSKNSYLPELSELYLDGNNFSGEIPDVLSKSLYLSTLDVSNNQFSGGVPRWMGNMSSLVELIMSNNHLQGTIPVEFCQLDLALLDLSVNNISGSIPSCFGSWGLLQLHLSKNRLRGTLPNALRNSSTLVTLDISDNFFSGSIPSWIGGLSSMSYLLLSKNNFQGAIPVELCKLNHLSLINLSYNNLSGRIPHCLKVTILDDVPEYYFDLITPARSRPFSLNEPIAFPIKNVSNSYKGRIIGYISGIDLSCNNLVGEIPNVFGVFYKILVLNLSHNSLTGPIPPTFANLKRMESLDLSHNKLRGSIPPQLVGLNFLAFFVVSFNNLSGKTPPRTAQFATFDESSYRGNPFLCGEPLPKCGGTGPSNSSTDGDEEDGLIDMGVFHVSFVVSYVVFLLTVAVVLYINPHWRRAWFYHAETTVTFIYYFVLDNIIPRRFHC